MAFSENHAARIRAALARKNVEEKKMFGGIGFLLNGNLLVGIWKDSLSVRLGPEQAEEALPEPHVKKFDITGRPAEPYKSDLKTVEFHRLDTGHFALEEDGDKIASLMRQFLRKHVATT